MAKYEITLEQLTAIQKEFDKDNFSGADTPEGKRRHIFLHLGKLLGKAANVEEQADHGNLDTTILRTEVIPDLLVFAAQLAVLEEVELSESYTNRLEWVAERNGTGAESAILAINSALELE